MKPGVAVGPYVIDRHLGDGGMGSVWLAEDTRLHRPVALKTVNAARQTDTAGRARLMREAQAAAAINHPNIATLYDVLEIDGDIVLVFEYVEGPTLATALLDGHWPLDRVVDCGLQLARALTAAHAKGVIHRDLKPSNVIIGAGGAIKVLDFGIARLMPLGTTITNRDETAAGFMGTVAYAAPEQLLSPAVDERADLYALGAILFELATGSRPFPMADGASLASLKLGSEAPPIGSTGTNVPGAFEALVTSLLARQPDRRPSSASEVLGALRAIAGEPSTARLKAPSRVRPLTWIAAVVVLAIAVGGALFTLGIPRRSSTPASPTSPVVAVLPLRNTSGDASKDYLAAGLSESLISGLASSPSLIVLSRAAVADAMKGDASIKRAVSDLGASLVIDGSVQQSGDALRVAINLVRADQSIAWGRTFDGTMDRVFDLQTRMALAVTEAMQAGHPSATAAPTNQAALDAYWRGRAFLDRWDVPGNIDASVAALQESVNTDANFALAHAGLGLAYWQKYNVTRDQQFARLAIDEGSKAAAVDPNLPEVHFALGVSLSGTGRREDAVKELRQAIALRPTFDEARRRLGIVLAADGKIDDAVTEFNAAIALRPKFWGGYSDLGLSLLNAARYDDALKAFEQVVALQPDNHIGYQQIGTIYQTKGDIPKAIDAYQKSLAIRPSFGPYANLGAMEHQRGRYPEAIAAYRKAIELRPNLASLYRNIGDSLLRMGKSDEAHREYLTAIDKTKADLSVNPTSARTIAALAVYQAKAGETADALASIANAIKLAPDDVQVLYRSAVVNTITGRTPQALIAIGAAIDRGYSIRSIQDEEDFASLRSNQQFTRLIQARQTQ